MKLEVQSTLSVVFLSIFNMCICLQDIAEKTLNSLNNDVQHTKRHQQNHNNHHHHPNRWGFENFLLIDYLADGEMERRISYKGVTAKETSIGNSSKSLSLWQLSNGLAFIQMIYSRDDELIDCEYVREDELVNDFLEKFYNEVEIAKTRNFSSPLDNHFKKQIISNREFRQFSENGVIPNDYYEEPEESKIPDAFGMRNLDYKKLMDDKDVPDDMLPLLNYKNLKIQCDERHRQMQQIVSDLNGDHEEIRRNATEHLERKKRSLSDWLIAPNIKWCGRGQSAGNYNQLGGASKADKCCRRHDHCKLNIQAMFTKWHLFNYRPFTISHCSCDMRQRRDLSNLLRVPGTKWCGKGWTAEKYTDLGGFSKADRCCRQHDKSCPFWIMGFETKYGFFNWRINTIMHCKCDERRRVNSAVLWMHQIISGRLDSPYLRSQLKLNTGVRTLRNPEFIKIKNSRTDYGWNSPFNNACKAFNCAANVVDPTLPFTRFKHEVMQLHEQVFGNLIDL